MKKLFPFVFLPFLLSSCATIIGGSSYRAHVTVMEKPQAEIFYKGSSKGFGSAKILVKRKEAGSFSFDVKQGDCEKQTYNYTSRTFRGWACFADVILFTGITAGSIPIPYGVAIDLLTGAYWKPNVKLEPVRKSDYKNYYYNVSYKVCENDSSINSTQSVQEVTREKDEDFAKYEKLKELKELLDKGIISKEEFELEKKRILGLE